MVPAEVEVKGGSTSQDSLEENSLSNEPATLADRELLSQNPSNCEVLALSPRLEKQS
jgi:hypothetical protein